MAEEFGKLLQLRETLGEAMVVLMVNGELEAVSRRSVGNPRRRRRNLIAVDGGENLAERLGLVGVKAQPEGAGCLYLIISSWPAKRHGRCSGRTMLSVISLLLILLLLLLLLLGERQNKRHGSCLWQINGRVSYVVRTGE